MSPDLAALSAPIQYTKDDTTYTFGTQSSEGILPDRIKVETKDDKVQFKEYLREFGIEGRDISTNIIKGSSRIDALATTSDDQAVLIPDLLDTGDTIVIEMSTEDKEIFGYLHNTNQSKNINFTKPTDEEAGRLKFSGQSSFLQNTINFGTDLEHPVNVTFAGFCSIPGGTTNCYGDVLGVDSHVQFDGDDGTSLMSPTLISGATLNLLGGKLNGALGASVGSVINIGGPLP